MYNLLASSDIAPASWLIFDEISPFFTVVVIACAFTVICDCKELGLVLSVVAVARAVIPCAFWLIRVL